jgi:hypothetical protein
MSNIKHAPGVVCETRISDSESKIPHLLKKFVTLRKIVRFTNDPFWCVEECDVTGYAQSRLFPISGPQSLTEIETVKQLEVLI